MDLIAPFFIGFFGSFHCLGMCGPLVVAYGLHLHAPQGSHWHTGLLHHAAFHLGRLLSYGCMGVIAAGLLFLIDFKHTFNHLRGGVALLGGILMILAGLTLLKRIPSFDFLSLLPSRIVSSCNHWLHALFRSQSRSSKIVLGIFTGFLPCMLSWSMVSKAITTGNALMGFLTLLSFGMGTVPILFLTGLSASMISMKLRIAGERIAALSIILMGCLLALKGVRSLV